MFHLQADNVVIGSGPGGAMTAALLAEAGREVLLIEEGAATPLDSCEPFTIQEMVQKYRNRGMTVGLGVPKVAYVEGCVAGGGSEINSGLYHRPPESVLERWRQQWLVTRLENRLLDPLAAQNEADVSVQSIPGDRKPPASLRLHEGASALGWKSFEVPRWIAFDGSYDVFGVPRGIRQSMSRTFLPRLERAGGGLETGIRVDRFERLANSWKIHAWRRGGRLQIQAGHLFVCAGAVQTPFLLQRSGIVKRRQSRLLMHPTIKAVARFADVVNEVGAGVGVHQVKQFSPRISLGCSISSKPYLALSMLDYPNYRHWVDSEFNKMGVYYAMVDGGGEGSVRSVTGFTDPLVRYRVNAPGRRDLAFGLVVLCRALLTAGATEIFPGITDFGPPIRSFADLTRIPNELPASRVQLMTIHLLGSCPMGESSASEVCDGFGRVKGYPALNVNDASLLCDSPGVNPQGTVMLVARRNVMHFLGSV